MKLKETVEKVVRVQFPDAVVNAPLPVWDSKNLVGVSITIPKQMGKMMCEQTVSFPLMPVEVKDISAIQKRTILAMSVLKTNMVSAFREIVAKEKAA